MMTQGLQIFNANGVCTLDVTDNLTRILGIIRSGTSDGSLYDASLSTGTPWCAVSTTGYGTAPFWQSLYVSFSGNTMYWEHVLTNAYGLRIDHQIIYGVY